MPLSKKYRNNNEAKQAMADAWLNLIDEEQSKATGNIVYSFDENKLGNPLQWPAEFNDKPEQYIYWVMSQPEYFYFTCKEIMNITLSPTQCVVLKELWNRKFPMYIATRGFGKAIHPDTPVRVEHGWRPIKELGPGDKVYGGDGKLCNVTGTTHVQKDLDFYRLTFKDGRTFECCKDHQWKVWDVTKREWVVKTTLELFENYYWIKNKEGRTTPHKEFRYAIPLNGPVHNGEASVPAFFPAHTEVCTEYNTLTFANKKQFDVAYHYYLARGYYVQIFREEMKLHVYKKDRAKSAEAISKLDKVFICDIAYVGKKDGMCITVDSPDHTYIVENYIVTHNSFLLGVYALLRLMFMPKRKVVIAGAAFRQSKIIFEYMENIYHNAPRLRDLFGPNNGPKHENDMYKFRFNESVVVAIPIGNGEKIRGLRANDLLVDEFNCLAQGSLVETENGLVRIEDFDRLDSNVLTGSDNITEKPDKFITTPLTDVYEIKLKNGYIIRCSKKHHVMTDSGWKNVLDLKVGDCIERSPKGNFSFGKLIDGLDEKIAWLLGILVSEGSVVSDSLIQVTTTDSKTCEKLVNEYGFNLNIKDEYVDNRGWNCKLSYKLHLTDKNLRNQLCSLGLEYVKAHDKKIPWAILKSPKSVIQAFLSGLFDGDGSCFLFGDKFNNKRIGLAYYSVSERLCRDVQVLMYKLGWDGYINNRDSEISENKQWFVRWNNVIAKEAAIFLNVDRFKEAIRNCKTRKIDSIKYYDSSNMWRVRYKSKAKSFRKKEDALDFLSSLDNCIQYQKIVSITKLPEQQVLYDYYLPASHSFYADGFRQHNSISRELFETVLVGFTAVSSDPIVNQQAAAGERLARLMGWWEDDVFDIAAKDNQLIISGTAGYTFQHFYKYWKDWHDITTSGNDKKKLENYFARRASDSGMDMDEIAEQLNPENYSIIRIPIKMIPKGVMDIGAVSRARATMHSGTYQNEYGAVFSDDSQGFFKRSLIENCTVSQGEADFFEATLFGDLDKVYVFGVDPASEVDNFAIVIVELAKGHRRIVYSWTTNKAQHRKEVKDGICKEQDYYSYCARKIRNLMRRFPCARIMMDSQGGGYAIMEQFRDPENLQPGEHLMLPVIDPKKPQDTDMVDGDNIVELVNFRDSKWTGEANHGMRLDFELRQLRFPYFDALSLSKAEYFDDNKTSHIYDSLEDCTMDIQELKDELANIIMTQTNGGQDKWDTPEEILPGGKKGRIRKDRYSALLMANMGARILMEGSMTDTFESMGGWSGKSRQQQGGMYTQSYFSDWAEDFYKNY